MSMTRVWARALACVALLSCTPSAPKFKFTHTERRGRLESNGLRFVLMPDSSTQLAEVDIRYDVGSREDPPGRAGLAHLVEHLMFQTRPDGPTTAPIFQTILDLATDMNAYTNWDTTHYRMTSRSENLEAMLKIEAMRMFYGCQNIPKEEFEREREVVRNEIRAQSSAENQIYQHVEAAIYPKGHAYERMIGGNDEQIASATLEEACEFMKKYYAPERATLLVAGGVDIDETVGMIQKWFAKIPKRAPAPRVEVKPFTVDHQKKEIEADVERPAVWIGWALPAANTPEGEMARFGILGAFFRLARASQDYEFAYSVQPTILGGQLAPLALIRIELKGLGKLDEALEFAQKAAKQAYRGWDEGSYEDMEEEQNRQKASFIEGLERLKDRTEEVANMVQFSKDFDFDSTDMYLFHQLDKIAKFDNAKVGAVVKNALSWEKAAIVVVKPGTNGIKGDVRSKVKFETKGDQQFTNVDVDPAEAKRPIRNAGTLKSLSGATKFKMKNGMEVIMLQVKAMPLVAAQLIFKNAGNAATPNNPALASAAADFLQGPMDSEALRKTGINVGCRATDDAMICGTHGVNIYLDVMLKGLERQIRAGTYSQEQIESWQKNVREQNQLKSSQEDDEYVRQVNNALYGADHPYSKSAILTTEAANKLHKDSLDDFRDAHYQAGNATLVIVGDFDPKYGEKVARDVYEGWNTGTVDKPVEAKAAKRTGPAFVGVQKSKTDQQVTVTIAYPAPAGMDGQEAARRVLSEMLNLRAEDVRFKLGSTYGLSFVRVPKIGPTSYMLRGGAIVGGTIDAERAGESIKALRANLDALRAGDHFDEDFVRARRKIISGLLGESTVTTELAQRLSTMAIYGLQFGYYNTLLQQVAAVSPAQVRALIKTELDPQTEVVVMLGDKDHLNKTFAEAGITDVKLVEPDYK
ncbi:MAG: insulinase family protein [Kofleriaceae bacterium]|nr:insulinase family protein [Kofleriaceae bacterium]